MIRKSNITLIIATAVLALSSCAEKVSVSYSAIIEPTSEQVAQASEKADSLYWPFESNQECVLVYGSCTDGKPPMSGVAQISSRDQSTIVPMFDGRLPNGFRAYRSVTNLPLDVETYEFMRTHNLAEEICIDGECKSYREWVDDPYRNPRIISYAFGRIQSP